MPFRRLHFEATTGEPFIIQPPPPKLGYLAAPSESLLADMRMATIWYAILERDPEEARQKLYTIVRTDLHADFPTGLEPPCLVKIDEGKTQLEKERIRRALRRISTIYANLVDRLVRYRPESRQFAFDAFKQELVDKSAIWRPYECTKFRTPAEETEGKSKKRNAPIFFNVPEARAQLEVNGIVYTLRKERGTGETTARSGNFYKFDDLGRVNVEPVKKISNPAELEPFVQQSGFTSIQAWTAKASPGADWLYKVTKA